MIIDARRDPPSGPLECDICIVGGGAAGITLALELANAGRRICLLESGGPKYELRTQGLYGGEISGDLRTELRETRLACLGGSTHVWAGWCRPLDPCDFETRDWIEGSGWPFGASELRPFYARAHEMCGLGDPDYDAASWERRLGNHRLPVSGDEFLSSVFHVSRVRFGTAFGPTLARAAQIRALLHANALRLVLAPDSERVARVEVGTLNGRRFDVVARTFVLAAGGIENARLLLLSGDSPERSIGNAHDLVGRCFMEHGFVEAGFLRLADPRQSLVFYFPQRFRSGGRKHMIRAVLAPTPAVRHRERLLGCAIFFRPWYEADPVFEAPEVKAMLEVWDGLRGRAVPGRLAERTARMSRAPRKLLTALCRRLFARPRPQASWRLRAALECTPDRGNRVTLSGRRDALDRPLPHVRWCLGELDIHSVRRAHQLLDVRVRKDGLGRIEPRLQDDADSWRAAVDSGKHHMGTTRMHVDPRRGVVDANSRVHGIANLYVAGGSVFPTAGFANPTLTIVALAARLAAHLRTTGG